MDLQLFSAITKYPFIQGDEFHSCRELEQNTYCVKKCKERDCLYSFKKAEHGMHFVCSHGYDNTFIILSEFTILINGMLFADNPNLSKELKFAKQKWIISKNDLKIFIDKVSEIENQLINSQYDGAEKNFSMFHDFKTSMSIIYKCTQSIIGNLQGDTFEEKLQRSDRDHQNLYHSLNLITSQLGMMDVILNPSSISFGSKRNINIFKLFDKVRMLFGYHLQSKVDVDIRLISINDRDIHDSYCFNSIEFIPLILLDNAIKYSAPGSTIRIEMRQYFNKVQVSVESIGPFVADENKEKIFDKFFRDDTGKQFAKEGIGMGLWIARQILRTNNSDIIYYKDVNARGLIGLNIFQFVLETTVV